MKWKTIIAPSSSSMDGYAEIFPAPVTPRTLFPTRNVHKTRPLPDAFHGISTINNHINTATMLRRAPTSISLSSRDVTDHLENIERKKQQSRKNLSAPLAYELTDSLAAQLQTNGENEKNEVTFYEYGNLNQQRALQGRAPSLRYPQEIEEEASWEESPTSDLNQDGLQHGELLTTDAYNDSENEQNIDPLHSAENPGNLEERPMIRHEESSQPSSQTPRNTFDYGGFVEVNADQSPSFLPQVVSTLCDNEMPESYMLRSRCPKPRSPLFRAQGVNSPERRLTASLTPRVASYGTPSLLLSQPARRPRSYRPRTISYSFEESERASAACEQVHTSDNDSNGSQQSPKQQRSLHEELEVECPQSASLESNVPSSPPEFTETSLARIPNATPSAERNQRALSSSPQLPLPPPFSAVRRNFSLTAPLTLAHEDAGQLRSTTPIYGVPHLPASPIVGSNTSSQGEDDSGPGSSSILRNVAALPLRLLSVYRSRSPFQTRFDGAGSGRVSPRPQRSQSQGPEEAPPTSIRRQFEIYDDSIPAISQPQTPQHLREARHQSRFHPSYTAPASGRMASPRASRSEVTRRRGTRSDSPTGMETPGFQGLYGGRENLDDDVMFDRASQRLWALSSARRLGRSMSSTPDREPSFADSRGDLR